MSRLITDVTLDEIDDWFKIGKEKTKKPIVTVPRSATGGRSFNPQTGKAHEPAKDNFGGLPSHKSGLALDQQGYAASYQAQEQAQLLQYHQALEPSDKHSVVGRLEQLELDSTVAGSTIPDNLIPVGSTEVYNNYAFSHKYDDKLPITKHRDDVISTIESNQVTVIQGSTGSGKTTQVPQFILDYYRQEHKHCNIIVTQPRRIAAVSVARRVCAERSWTMGTLCGYQIGMDNKTSDDTRITYCTTGVLREKLIKDKNMHLFTHVILDEVHERDQESDFALLIVRKLLHTNSRHVKVILMSATIDCDLFANYFALPVRGRMEPAPVISVEGKIFNVLEFYADDLAPVLGDLPDLDEAKPELSVEVENMAVKLICEFDQLERKEQGLDKDTGFSPIRGTVLCFLPGYGEISDLFDKLRELESKHNLKVIPLHSTITQEEQMRVFEAALKGQRKVILSTNIAESSITVPDIKYVIDFCLTKNLVCDPMTNYTHLMVDWAAKSNCTQRKGRAGRVSNGRAYFMVTKSFFETCLPDFGTPEMQRCPLETLVLKTKIFNMGEPRALLGLALSPPNLDDIERTILNLKEVGALSTSYNHRNNPYDGELTFMGKVLADLPVDIRIGKLLVMGHVFAVLEECLIIGAAMSLKSIFARPFKAKLKAFEQKFIWSACSLSDSIAIINAFKVWENNKINRNFQRSGMSEKKFGEKNFIQIRRINEVADLMTELEQRLSRFAIQRPRQPPRFKMNFTSPKERILLKLVLCSAFYPNYFLRGENDEVSAVRELSNHDPANTVILKGLPANQGMLYKETLETKFKVCSHNPPPVVHFEETKAFITFPWKANQPYEMKVHQGVYTAIKLRLLRLNIEVETYTKEDAHLIASNLHQAQEVEASKGQLRTNRLRGGDSPGGHSESREGRVVEPPPPDMSGVYIWISEVIECGHFWAQYYSEEAMADLGKVQDDLNKPGALLQPISGVIRPGTYCAAAYTDEGALSFYRARVLEVNNNAVTVFYMDYGNTGVNIPRAYVRVLPPHLLLIPFQAFECYLCNIRPSTLKCPDGVWSEQANTWFKTHFLNQRFYARVFSVVRDALRLDCVGQWENNQQFSLNEEVKREGYADTAEETYLSKQNHDMRSSEAMTNPATSDLVVTQQQGGMQFEMQAETKAALKGSKRMIRLSGPHSPLEMNFHSMTSIGRLRSARIDQDSINCVAIDDEPQNRHARLMVAGFVGMNPTRTAMMARDTTIMPLIPGLPALVSLLFAPCAELRSNPKRTHYTGVLCGLGYDERTNVPILSDHDMEITFDTHFDNEDIEEINRVRLAINFLVGKVNNEAMIGDCYILKLQDKARTRLLSLIERRRPPIEELYNYERPYHWNQIDPDYLLEPGLDTDADDHYLLTPHYGIDLVQQEEDDSYLNEARHSDYLKRHLQMLKSLSIRPRSEPVTCELCNVPCPTPRVLSSHLHSESHMTKESKLYGIYN